MENEDITYARGAGEEISDLEPNISRHERDANDTGCNHGTTIFSGERNPFLCFVPVKLNYLSAYNVSHNIVQLKYHVHHPNYFQYL